MHSGIGWTIGLGAAGAIGAGIAGFGYGRAEAKSGVPANLQSSKASLALLTASGLTGSVALMNAMVGSMNAGGPVGMVTVGATAGLVVAMSGALFLGKAIGERTA